ncbi:hypothetical protein QJQ45_022402 [Haematococcus lacustris]|nr:hypothetical protein QJQ45_022402 [Haematococcus lacustris]
MRFAMHHLLLLAILAVGSAASTGSAAAVRTVSLTLKHQGTPVPFTIYLPPAPEGGLPPKLSQASPKLPAFFLLQGFNVEAAQYSDILKLLAAKGYLVIASDYFRPLPPFLSPNLFPPKKGCRSGEYLQTSVALLATLLRNISSDPQLKDIASNGIVLFGHSNGGAASAAALDGQCDSPAAKSGNTSNIVQRFCQGYVPTFAPGAGVLAATQKPQKPGSFKIFEGQRGSRVLGAVLFEGHLSGGPTSTNNNYSSIQPLGVNLPKGTFLTYLAGEYNNNTLKGYEATAPLSPTGCASFARFAVTNHFGLNNWQPGGGQVTLCARAAMSDPTELRVSKDVQGRALTAMASLIDDTVRSNVLGDAAATSRLRNTKAAAGHEGGASGGAISDVRFSKACPAAK